MNGHVNFPLMLKGYSVILATSFNDNEVVDMLKGYSVILAASFNDMK